MTRIARPIAFAALVAALAAAGSASALSAEACAANAECASGYCVDGVCCDAKCDGQCEACDLPGLEGTCSAVAGAPHGERAACAGAGEECGGVCDGAERARCAYSPPGTRCGALGCEDGAAWSSECNGQGACVENPITSCAPYACAEVACRSECASDSECASGSACRDGECRFVAGRCSADRSRALDGAGVPIGTCAPYFCTDGRCATSCTTSAECAADHACAPARSACVPIDGGSEEPGGGGSRGALGGRGAAPRSLEPLWAALAVAAGLRRRRSARRR